jgi:hypothetical protein
MNEIKMLDDLIKTIEDMKKAYEKEAEKKYREAKHNEFAVGDWVTNGEYIGVVGWIENKHMNMKNGDGYFGLNIKNGDMGFMAPCKTDEFRELTKEEKEFFTYCHHISFYLSGESILRLLYDVGPRNCNPSKPTTILTEKLENIVKKFQINKEE